MNICGHITLGGGEPLLAKKEMFYLLDQLDKRMKKDKISIWEIGMITNGTIFDEEIVNRLNRFTETLLCHYNTKVDDKGKPLKVIHIGISNDEYHNNNPKESMKWFKEHVNKHIMISYNKLSNKNNKYDIVECKRSKKNGLKALKKYGLIDLHRFILQDYKFTKIADGVEVPILDGDCLTFTSTGKLISNGFYDFSEVEKEDFINYMGNYMDNDVMDLIKQWNIKHPLCERHTMVFEDMMRKAMMESDRERIREKFYKKENEVKNMIAQNPDMKLYEIYNKVLHF